MAKVILDVPKIKQTRNNCGPASLAMVFQYYGYANTQHDIANWFDCDSAENGVDAKHMLHCARDHGFVAHARNSLGLEGIIRSIDRGIPVIALVQSPKRGRGHAVVVRGYETDPNIVWVNDPSWLIRDRMIYENFAKRWRIRRKRHRLNQYGLVLREP